MKLPVISGNFAAHGIEVRVDVEQNRGIVRLPSSAYAWIDFEERRLSYVKVCTAVINHLAILHKAFPIIGHMVLIHPVNMSKKRGYKLRFTAAA